MEEGEVFRKKTILDAENDQDSETDEEQEHVSGEALRQEVCASDFAWPFADVLVPDSDCRCSATLSFAFTNHIATLTYDNARSSIRPERTTNDRDDRQYGA